MFNAVLLFLKETPASVLSKLPIIVNLTKMMEEAVDELEVNERKQMSITSGKGANKVMRKTKLVEIALSTGRALLSFANNSSNVELSLFIKTMLKLMDRQADITLVSRCNSLLNKAMEYANSLAPFGVTNDTLTELEAEILNYEGLQADLRNRIAARGNATLSIANLNRKLTALLKEQIDPAVYSLNNEPEMLNYKALYKGNRIIISTGHRYTQIRGVAVQKGTGKKLENVQLELKARNRTVKVKTNFDGVYKQLLHPDIYSIIATCEGFEPFVIDGVKIKAGEIKVENMEMVAKG